MWPRTLPRARSQMPNWSGTHASIGVCRCEPIRMGALPGGDGCLLETAGTWSFPRWRSLTREACTSGPELTIKVGRSTRR